jgi:anti-sigma factor RsiW
MDVDEWTDRISEYLDESLDAASRTALEAHLATCADCSAELDGLRAVIAQAARLPELPPTRDLWPSIEARLARRQPAGSGQRSALRERLRMRWSFSTPQLVAATALVAALSGLVGWLATDRAGTPRDTGALASEPTEFVQTARAVSFADPKYDQAIADLMAIVSRERDRLDPRTLAAINRSLASIDKAIDEARTALDRDPASAYLTRHLADTRRKKLDVLRIAVDLTTKGS